jgi:hypothetical protein
MAGTTAWSSTVESILNIADAAHASMITEGKEHYQVLFADRNDEV